MYYSFSFLKQCILFLNPKVKSPFSKYNILIYHVVLLDLHLSRTNKPTEVRAIHSYAVHSGCNKEDSLEGGSNGVSCLACQHNWGQNNHLLA